MTVATSTRKQIFSGGQSSLVFNFRALTSAPSSILVSLQNIATGAVSNLNYNVDYTVSVNASGIGGTVTVSPTYSTAYNYVVYRSTPITQSSAYTDYNQFPAGTIEAGLDQLTMIEQEQNDNISRKAGLSIAFTGSTVTLPNPVDGNVLTWSGSTGAMTNTIISIPSTIGPISVVGSNVGIGTSSPAYPLDVNGAINTNNDINIEGDLITKGPYADIRKFGAVVGTDALTAITAALASSAGTVYVPPGTWYISNTIVVPTTNYGGNLQSGKRLLLDQFATIQTTGDFHAVQLQNGAQLVGGTIYVNTLTAAHAAIYVYDATTEVDIGTLIKDVNIYGNFSNVVGTATGIEFYAPSGTRSVVFVTINNVSIYGVGKGFYAHTASDGYVNGNNFTDVYIWNFVHGLYLMHGADNNNFKGVQLESAATGVTDGVYCAGGANIFDVTAYDLPASTNSYNFTSTSTNNKVVNSYDQLDGTLQGAGIIDLGTGNEFAGHNVPQNLFIGSFYTGQSTATSATNSLIVQNFVGIGIPASQVGTRSALDVNDQIYSVGNHMQATDYATNGGYITIQKDAGLGTKATVNAGDNNNVTPIAINSLATGIAGYVGIRTATAYAGLDSPTTNRLKNVRLVTGAVITNSGSTLTLTGAQMAANSIFQETGTTASTFTLDTGTALSTAVPGVQVGDMLWFVVSNASTQTITMAGATGTALANVMTVATLQSRTFHAINTGTNTWSIF